MWCSDGNNSLYVWIFNNVHMYVGVNYVSLFNKVSKVKLYLYIDVITCKILNKISLILYYNE